MTLMERIDKRMELVNKMLELDLKRKEQMNLAYKFMCEGQFEKANEVYTAMDDEEVYALRRELEELDATEVEEDKKQDAEVALPYEVVIYGKTVATFEKEDYAELFSKFWQTAHFQRWASVSGYKLPDTAKRMTEIIMEAVPVDESLQFLERIEENIKIRQKNS